MQGFRELIQLHLVHQSERDAARRQDERRAQLLALEAEIESARQSLEAAETETKRIQQERRKAEQEVERLEQMRKKYRSQLMEAKTNEVYKTLLHEIETAAAAISASETVVIELLETADGVAAAASEARRAVADAEARKTAEEATIRGDLATLEDERAAARERAAAIEPLVPELLIAQYRRVAEARDGRGMAQAVEFSCSACHVAVRPQAWVDMVAKDQPHACAGCKRLLYREENLRSADGADGGRRGASEPATSEPAAGASR